MVSAILAGQHAHTVNTSAYDTLNALRQLAHDVGAGAPIHRNHPNLTDLLEPTAYGIVWWRRGSRGIWAPSQQPPPS